MSDQGLEEPLVSVAPVKLTMHDFYPERIFEIEGGGWKIGDRMWIDRSLYLWIREEYIVPDSGMIENVLMIRKIFGDVGGFTGTLIDLLESGI